jgi:hypothetical protein
VRPAILSAYSPLCPKYEYSGFLLILGQWKWNIICHKILLVRTQCAIGILKFIALEMARGEPSTLGLGDLALSDMAGLSDMASEMAIVVLPLRVNLP